MKVLFVTAGGSRGGAATAARRIAYAVRDCGIDASMLITELSSGDDLIIANARWASRFPFIDKLLDRLPVLGYRNRTSLMRELNFSAAVRRRDWSSIINDINADVVHLHWVNYGLISPEGLKKIRAPIVWTLHDMWPFTGGCHHSSVCDRYLNECGRCPVLGSKNQRDISHLQWLRKRRSWTNVPMEIVAPSRWMAGRATQSSLFNRYHITQISNPVDIDIFSSGDAAEARSRFGLPQKSSLVLFCANKVMQASAKGYSHLIAALCREVSVSPMSAPHAVVIGGDTPGRHVLDSGVTVHMLGYLSTPQLMAQAYRAADVVAVASRNENFPNTIAEAMACGVPCAAFGVGGILEMIDHGKTGYIVKPEDDDDLAAGLRYCIAVNREGRALGAAARVKAEDLFDKRKIGEAYVAAYERAAGAAINIGAGRLR